MLELPSREASKEKDWRESGKYIRDHREDDFVRGFVSKLLAYALGRSLAISDDPLIGKADGQHGEPF